MLVSRTSITRKLSSRARSCEIQDEGLNSSSVSSGLQMAGQKTGRRKCIASPQLLSGFFCVPRVCNCHMRLQKTASADSCTASFCAQLQGFLHRRETNFSYCLTSYWVPPLTSVSHLQWFSPLCFSHRIWLLNPRRFGSSHCTEFLFSFRSGPWGGSLQHGTNAMMSLPHNESINEALGLKGPLPLGQKYTSL